MKYLVLECGLSYAVVLDEEGKFLKVPNLGYEVGQELDHVVLQKPIPKAKNTRRHLLRLGTLAACLCLAVLGAWQFWFAPSGTVRIKINPDVQLVVNHLNRVVEVKGLNQDGTDLLAGYKFYGKKMDVVSDELASRAIRMGYLSSGGQITLDAQSSKEDWCIATEETLTQILSSHFEAQQIVIIIVPVERPLPSQPGTSSHPIPSTPIPSTPIPSTPIPSTPVPTTPVPTTPAPTPPRPIGMEKAKELALAHFSLSEARFQECKLDDGVYELEFTAGGKEYECDVDAYTGKILKAEAETAPIPTIPSSISAEKAKELALAHFSLSEAVFQECKLDDGVYELEFTAGEMEYECDIDSYTGKILKAEAEPLPSATEHYHPTEDDPEDDVDDPEND